MTFLVLLIKRTLYFYFERGRRLFISFYHALLSNYINSVRAIKTIFVIFWVYKNFLRSLVPLE